MALREKFYWIPGISLVRALRNSTSKPQKEYASVAEALNDFSSGAEKATPYTPDKNKADALDVERRMMERDAKERRGKRFENYARSYTRDEHTLRVATVCEKFGGQNFDIHSY